MEVDDDGQEFVGKQIGRRIRKLGLSFFPEKRRGLEQDVLLAGLV